MSQSLPMDDEGRWGRALEPEAIALTDAELREAACRVDPREATEQPDKAWTRYLRAVALIALRHWISQRKADLTVGPELEPEDPQRLLALNGCAAQLLCCSPMDESVEVPVEVWQQKETAPQLLLLAQVDEDNGLVHFPGALDAASVVAELSKQKNSDPVSVPIALERFDGGLEQLLRWLALIPSEALARNNLAQQAVEQEAGLLQILDDWLKALLASDNTLTPIPVAGTRSSGETSLRLINPIVKCDENGTYIARAACPNPTIWPTGPLAEIQIWRKGSLIWRRRSTRTSSINGPILWPVEPMKVGEELTLHLRPHNSPGGSNAVLRIVLESIRPEHTAILKSCRTRYFPFSSLGHRDGISSMVSIEAECMALIAADNKWQGNVH